MQHDVQQDRKYGERAVKASLELDQKHSLLGRFCGHLVMCLSQPIYQGSLTVDIDTVARNFFLLYDYIELYPETERNVQGWCRTSVTL